MSAWGGSSWGYGGGGGGTSDLAAVLAEGNSAAGPILLGSGTAAGPSYSFTNGAASGFYLDGTLGNVGVSDGGTLMALWRNSANAIRHKSTVQLTWSSGSPDAVVEDTGLKRASAGVVQVTDGGSGSGSLQLAEMPSDPSALANAGRLFVRDNGAGKTELCVRFGTGAVQVIATEP